MDKSKKYPRDLGLGQGKELGGFDARRQIEDLATSRECVEALLVDVYANNLVVVVVEALELARPLKKEKEKENEKEREREMKRNGN